MAFRTVTTGSTFTENVYRQINVENAVGKFEEYLGLKLNIPVTNCEYNMRVLTINDFLITMEQTMLIINLTNGQNSSVSRYHR